MFSFRGTVGEVPHPVYDETVEVNTLRPIPETLSLARMSDSRDSEKQAFGRQLRTR